MELNEAVLNITIALYSKKHLVRNDVQFIINLIRDFITETYNPFLLGQLKKYLHNAVSNEAMDEVDF